MSINTEFDLNLELEKIIGRIERLNLTIDTLQSRSAPISTSCAILWWNYKESNHTLIDVLRDFQVFPFGYVPLKAYFLDGDIDLRLFSKNRNLNDTWATEICSVLESEEKSEYAEFHVKEVHYIKDEVYSLLSLSF